LLGSLVRKDPPSRLDPGRLSFSPKKNFSLLYHTHSSNKTDDFRRDKLPHPLQTYEYRKVMPSLFTCVGRYLRWARLISALDPIKAVGSLRPPRNVVDFFSFFSHSPYLCIHLKFHFASLSVWRVSFGHARGNTRLSIRMLLMAWSQVVPYHLLPLYFFNFNHNARRRCHKPRCWCARRWRCRSGRRRRRWCVRDGGVRAGSGLVPAAHRGDCAVSGSARGPRWVLLRVLHRLLRGGTGRRGLRRRGLLLLLRHARLRRGRAGGAGLPGLLRRVLRGLQ
jgi:hypothetical protein